MTIHHCMLSPLNRLPNILILLLLHHRLVFLLILILLVGHRIKALGFPTLLSSTVCVLRLLDVLALRAWSHSICTSGAYTWATIISRGIYSCCTPHRDVIFVLLYRTKYKTQKGKKLTNTRDFGSILIFIVGKLWCFRVFRAVWFMLGTTACRQGVGITWWLI